MNTGVWTQSWLRNIDESDHVSLIQNKHSLHSSVGWGPWNRQENAAQQLLLLNCRDRLVTGIKWLEGLPQVPGEWNK